MQFKPNFNLLMEWKRADKIRLKKLAGAAPCVAVFKSDKKTLVYMCDEHGANLSFDMVDFCFSNNFDFKPDILLTEMENEGYEKKFGLRGIANNTLAYAAAVATKKNIPVVFADLSDSQMIDVIRDGFPNRVITNEDLHNALRSGPDKDGNIYEQMCEYLCRMGRDRFMLENIAVALNKYDTVFAIFGTGHYEDQRSVLEDMLGKPEYITKIKNARGDFADIKIKPVKICDFKLKK